MTYQCSSCGRYGMEWDGRAKILICCYNECNHVIRIENQKDIPSDEKILEAIRNDDTVIEDEAPDELMSG
jgi:hypothetical protein